MRATCIKPASPLAQNAFSPNQSGKLGFYHIWRAPAKRGARSPRIPNPVGEVACRVCGTVELFRAETPRRGDLDSKASHPLSPVAGRGNRDNGIWVGTPLPVGFQATRWKRRIRIAPGATRGTAARPSTRIATKRIFAHISCEGLRQPLESRERTPVSNTCHSV